MWLACQHFIYLITLQAAVDTLRAAAVTRVAAVSRVVAVEVAAVAAAEEVS